MTVLDVKTILTIEALNAWVAFCLYMYQLHGGDVKFIQDSIVLY